MLADEELSSIHVAVLARPGFAGALCTMVQEIWVLVMVSVYRCWRRCRCHRPLVWMPGYQRQ
jgi:hypothetical protein